MPALSSLSSLSYLSIAYIVAALFAIIELGLTASSTSHPGSYLHLHRHPHPHPHPRPHPPIKVRTYVPGEVGVG